MGSTANFDQFLAGLGLGVRVTPLTAGRIPRVAQLTQRTNQFNFTTIRHSEADLQRFLDSGAGEGFTIEVSDRFGDYGLAGAVIVSQEREGLAIDASLLRC